MIVWAKTLMTWDNGRAGPTGGVSAKSQWTPGRCEALLKVHSIHDQILLHELNFILNQRVSKLHKY